MIRQLTGTRHVIAPNFVTIENLTGADKEDTALLREMGTAAQKFISKHEWCPPIADIYFADGVGGIVALFLVEFKTKIRNTDKRLWVINGDLPDAYLVVEANDSARDALERYCLLMDDWVQAVRTSDDLSKVFPVRAKATRDNADLLERRLDFLRKEIVPDFQSTIINPRE